MSILGNSRKKQLEKNLDIQIENNKFLREALRKEQEVNKILNKELVDTLKENKMLKDEVEALKRNVRLAYKHNFNENKKKTTRKPRVKKGE